MKITELFQNREFVVSAEVGPPKGIHIDGMVEEAKKYLTGVHFVNVTDNQSSVMRLGSLATCKVLKDAGLNPIFQLTCRDRNRIALQSDLLSAAMLQEPCQRSVRRHQERQVRGLSRDGLRLGAHYPAAEGAGTPGRPALRHTIARFQHGSGYQDSQRI